MTFAARDFSPRRGVSDEHIPQWICEERATKSGRKRPAALRVAPSSRLATGQIGRNERHRIYASDHLGFVQKHLPPRMRISNNTTLTLSRPTGEGRAGSVSCSFKSGWIHLPTEDDSPSSQSDWERAGVRVSLF